MNRKDRRAAEKGADAPAHAGETGRLFALALQCHQTGKMADAEGMYRHILSVNPRHADAQHLLGVLALQSGRPQTAVEMIRKAIALNSRAASFHNNIAEALRLLGRFDEAASHLKEALALDPKAAEALLNLGNIFRLQDRLDDAIAHYRRALALKPDYGDAHLNLGVALIDSEERDQAIAHLRRALALKPRAPEAFANLAIALAAERKFDEAIGHYRQSLALRPNHPETTANLGNALLGRGDVEEARAHYAEALRLFARRAGGVDPGLDPIDALWMALQGKRGVSFAEENALMSLLRTACAGAPVPDWLRLCDKAAKIAGLSGAARYELLVRRAISQWVARDARLGGTLEEAASLLASLSEPFDRNVLNSRAYATFLSALLAYEAAHPRARAAPGEWPEAPIIGDSHALAYDGAKLALDGAPHAGSARLVMGAKAWHLGEESANQYKWMFANAVAALPPGAAVVLSFGEIDCRLDEGILPFYRKIGGDLESVVREQVWRYVRHVESVTRPRGLRLLFLAVPAPHVAALRMSHPLATEEDTALLVRIVWVFNAALADSAAAGGHRFLDMHAISAGPDGSAHGRAHVDDYHLAPEALAQVLR